MWSKKRIYTQAKLIKATVAFLLLTLLLVAVGQFLRSTSLSSFTDVIYKRHRTVWNFPENDQYFFSTNRTGKLNSINLLI